MNPCMRRVVAAGIAFGVLGGCGRGEPESSGQRGFDTPDAAATTLVAALEHNDTAELARVLGPGTKNLISSGDDVADHNNRAAFIARYRTRHVWVAGGPNDLVLQIGPDAWPMPIPLVREHGRWRFDGAAGASELVSRRIGENELRTLDVMRGFGVAQVEYAATGHDGVAAGVFARKLRSDAGKRNGLYWEPGSGEEASPAGPLLAAATAEGYAGAARKQAPYHGYLFRLLLAQGPHASGGVRDYLQDGELTRGFGLLAWPVSYGESGVMTFMVNQDGVVWQRDFGSETTRLAGQILQFDPDTAWTPIPPEDDSLRE